MHHVAELRCGLSHRGGSDRKCRKLVAKYRDGDELESTGGPYRLASGEVATEFPNRLTAYPAHEIFDDPWRWEVVCAKHGAIRVDLERLKDAYEAGELGRVVLVQR